MQEGISQTRPVCSCQGPGNMIHIERLQEKAGHSKTRPLFISSGGDRMFLLFSLSSILCNTQEILEGWLFCLQVDTS